MANISDALVNQLSGTDPQNLMEYIIRQRIYDSRYWKEECFGLTSADVLEKAVQMKCIGNFPTHFLSLTLKLLQLHPEHELVEKVFVEQDEFKYVRALGLLYIRMTSRPVEIYKTLEQYYSDYRNLRVFKAPNWNVIAMDEFVHELLTCPTNNCLGITLPRLPNRRILQDAGYLPEGPRATALQDVLDTEYDGTTTNPALELLRHKARAEQNEAAIVAWNKRRQQQALLEEPPQDDVQPEVPPPAVDTKQPTKAKKKERNYNNLFPKKSKLLLSPTTETNDEKLKEHHSEEYWNEQRAKLGLGKLK
mgnify:CR=1 FL=1